MNLKQIKDLALKLTNEYSVNGTVISEGENADELNKMIDFANDAQMQLAKIDRIPANTEIQLSENIMSYDLPSDFWTLDKIFIKDDSNFTDFSDFEILNKKIVLHNSYDNTYTLDVYYYKYPTELSDDANVPEISAESHYLIATYIAAMVLISRGDFSQGGLLLNKFEAGKEDIIGLESGQSTISNVMGW